MRLLTGVFGVILAFWGCAAFPNEKEFIYGDVDFKYDLDNEQTQEFVQESLAQFAFGAHPDVGLKVPELVKKYGYKIETHEVETKDNYLLTVHRIPHGRNNTSWRKKPVVFLMHGLLCSSADWVLTGPNDGLAFILADLGYDVFLGNARGNTYSRKHKKYDPKQDKKKFWDFSWHEIGSYDLPAMIDLALKKSGQKQLYYIGHSQGTTSFFVLMTQKPEYNKKIKLMSALSPIVYMNNLPNFFLNLIANFQGPISLLGNLVGLHEFLPNSKLLEILGSIACKDGSILQGICANVLFLIAGYNEEQLNKTIIPVIVSNTPAGAATKQFYHYAQEINSGDFKQFDYGPVKNMAKYLRLTPPKYDLSKIEAKIALYYGNNDLLAAEEDVIKLYKKLKNVIKLQRIEGFNHLDFLWAIDVKTLLYKPVISLIERIEQGI